MGEESLSARLRRERPPMSDAEWEQQYDPQGAHDRRLETLLLRLIVAIENLGEVPTQRERPYQPFKPKDGGKPSGPVAIG